MFSFSQVSKNINYLHCDIDPKIPLISLPDRELLK